MKYQLTSDFITKESLFEAENFFSQKELIRRNRLIKQYLDVIKCEDIKTESFIKEQVRIGFLLAHIFLENELKDEQ